MVSVRVRFDAPQTNYSETRVCVSATRRAASCDVVCLHVLQTEQHCVRDTLHACLRWNTNARICLNRIPAGIGGSLSGAHAAMHNETSCVVCFVSRPQTDTNYEHSGGTLSPLLFGCVGVKARV